MKKYTDVLVLNKSYFPIHIVDWRKGISLIYQEAAYPLDVDLVRYDSFESWIDFSNSKMANNYPAVHTISKKIAIPEIVILSKYDKLPQREVIYSRQSLFERDNFRCYLCGEQFDKRLLTVDHVVPKSKGGATHWKNTATCCKPCNMQKADKDLSELKIKPIFMPKKPKWVSPLNKVPDASIRKSWKIFMYRTLTGE